LASTIVVVIVAPLRTLQAHRRSSPGSSSQSTSLTRDALSVPLHHGIGSGDYEPYADYRNGDWVALDIPAREVHNALFEGKSVQRCLIDLLARESKDELAGFQLSTDQIGR